MSLILKKSGYYLSAFKNAVIFKSSEVNNLPFAISIEVASVCNLSCKYCYQKDWEQKIKRKKGLMELSLFKDFIEQVGSSFYPRNLNFDLGGEPFLNPSVLAMVELASAFGKLTNITTNGTLLTDPLIDKILESGLDKLSISLDIFNGSNIRQGSSVLEVIAKVNKLLLKKRNSGKNSLRVVIRCINLAGTSVKKISDLFEIKPDAIILTPLGNWSGLVDSELSKQKYYHCLLPWVEMAMLYNGDFALCCNDPRGDLIVGNFPREQVKRIWQGEKLTEIRKMLANKSAAFILGQNCGECTRLRKRISLKEYLYFLKED